MLTLGQYYNPFYNHLSLLQEVECFILKIHVVYEYNSGTPEAILHLAMRYKKTIFDAS